MIQLFQQRDFGEKINATFQYITQNFRSLSLALVYIVGPVALAAGIASGIIQSDFLNLANLSQGSDSTDDPTAPFRMMQRIVSPVFALAAVFSLLAVLAASLVTYAHMKLYGRKMEQRMTASGEAIPISVAEVWEEMQQHIGRALIVSVLSTIVTIFATFFFVIPGIYIGIVFSLAMAVVVFEGTDFNQTLSRCMALIRDKWWSTFGLIIVMGIISGIAGLIFSLPAGIISFLISAKLLPDVEGFWLIAGNVLATVGGTLLRAIIYVALGFQYTNLVERQEGRGLLSAIDSIGTKPAQARESDEGTY